ncbi:MAG: ABC transporter permease [Comamonadaceae bacterium]|jgi:putative ABC transport system permease protein|nr:ABC transporter permease [Comamonadaceae bacterium]
MALRYGVGMKFWELGLKNAWRDWRAGQLRLLLVAVSLAVAALTAVGFFADRLQGGLERDARQLLGGDAVISSDRPMPAAFVDRARGLGLSMTQSVSFPTMARASERDGGDSKLVAFKAVESGYPLRGKLRIAAGPGQAEEVARDVPAPGQVWVDPSLLDALDLDVGKSLLLGDASFRIDRLIIQEPDRGAGFMSFSPRVMINQADVAATGLIQPASRTNYRLAVAGSDAQVRDFSRAVQSQIDGDKLRGIRVESLEGGRPEMRQTLDRAGKFLSLVALLAALLSAVAVAIVARGFAASHLDSCAMLRVLGQSQRSIALAYAFEFLLVGLIASFVGVGLGYAVHHVFVLLLAGLVESTLPMPGLAPALLGLGMGLTLMLAFGLPPVLQLAQVPPLRVMRRDIGNLRPVSLAVLLLGVAGFAGLLLAVSSDLKLGLIAVAGFAAAVLFFALISWLGVLALRASVNESTAPRWLVLATRQVAARPGYAVVQVSALAVGLLALVLLVLLRTDLIRSWQQATPPDAPNRFVINVQPEQGQDFQQALRDAGVQRFDWFPMIRGRLVAVNDKAISPQSYGDDRAQRLVEREFNLSHAAELPPHNELVAGLWTANDSQGLSVEDGLARTLGLKLGDRLTFDIAGQSTSARITSLRKVDWGSMRVNFFVIFPLAQMQDVPLTYISAFRAPEGGARVEQGRRVSFDNQLVRRFPNITNVDMTATIAQVQRVLGQVIRAVEFLFGFTLAAGLVVLFAAVTATREERTREFAIMMALGGRASLLRQVQRAELLGVGLLAGFLASSVASAVGWALAHFVFDFEWTASLWVLLAGSAAGAVLALAAGWWGLRSVLTTPVVQTLRRAQ